MKCRDLLCDAYGRIHGTVHRTVEGLNDDDLAFRPYANGNSIAWLIWHLSRVQDDHIANVAGTDQVWTSDGWAQRFGLPFEPTATGYGHGSAEVASVRVGTELLLGYHDGVYQRTSQYLETLSDDDLDRVVDEAWDPPVTLGVRLISVVADDLQHVGQAAYVRGLTRAR